MDGLTGTAPRASLSRLLTCHNPFYALSAVLVLHGVHTALAAGDGAFPALGVLLALAGYAMALGIAAIIVVRVAKVWEDARTVLCLIVLLLAAASVVLDDLLLADRELGRGALLVGLGVAMAVSEFVLASTRLRLGVLYRAPFHLLLALFYVYPLIVVGLLDDNAAGRRAPLALAIAGFPLASAMVFLLLIPAIRRGAAYVENNGTPWAWPWYPWPCFVFLGLAAVARGYLLCLSLFPGPAGSSPYQAFFLAPPALALALLLVERGLVVHASTPRAPNPALTWSLVAMGIALLCAWPRTPRSREAAALIAQLHACPPAALIAAGAATVYTRALLRRCPGAETLLTLSLCYAAIVGTSTVAATQLHAVPLGILAGLHAWLCLRSPSAPRGVLTLVFAVTFLVTALRGSWFTAGWGFIPLHASAISLLAIAHLCRDRVVRALILAPAGFLLLGLFTLSLALSHELASAAGIPHSSLLRALHLLGITSVTWAAAWRLRSRGLRLVACIQSACLLANLVLFSRGAGLPAGTVPIIWGVVSLILALAITLRVGHLRRRIVDSAGS